MLQCTITQFVLSFRAKTSKEAKRYVQYSYKGILSIEAHMLTCMLASTHRLMGLRNAKADEIVGNRKAF